MNLDVAVIEQPEEEPQALVVKSTTYQEPELVELSKRSSLGSLEILDHQ